MRDTFTFLKNFIQHPTAVGAISPSSQVLARTMIDWVDWENARGVVEFGPGTGVFTEAIQRALHPDAGFIAIEQSPELAQATRLRVPTANVIQGSATDVDAFCRKASIASVDAIICGLPWAAFSESLTDEIFESMFRVLRPGGQFATFAYWQGVILPAGIRFSRRLNRTFSQVEKSPTAWRNLPPAFVYRCVR
jgi:phospholipid N-methyltransferase